MDFRKTFDKIPESFDKYRPRYCDELFEKLIIECELNSNKKVLEIGPGFDNTARGLSSVTEPR